MPEPPLRSQHALPGVSPRIGTTRTATRRDALMRILPLARLSRTRPRASLAKGNFVQSRNLVVAPTAYVNQGATAKSMSSIAAWACTVRPLLRAVCADELQFEQDIGIRTEARWEPSSHRRTTKPLAASLGRRTGFAATERRRVQQTQTRQYTAARLDAKALHYPGGVCRSVFECGRG